MGCPRLGDTGALLVPFRSVRCVSASVAGHLGPARGCSLGFQGT